MARIYLDARSITDTPSGVGRYARQLIGALCAADTDHEFTVIRHRSNEIPLDIDATGSPSTLREITVDRAIDGVDNFLFGHRTLEAAFARGGTPDLYHSLFHILPRNIRRAVGDAPVVTTLHDFVWLDHPDASQPKWSTARTIEAFARIAIPTALRASDRVIAISEPTRRRARDFVDDDRMVTISHGVDDVFFEPTEPPSGDFAELADGDKPTIVAIGNHKPYKNLGLLVDAFSKLIDGDLDARLVLIGDCEGLTDQIAASPASEHVHLPGFVGDDLLRRLLGAARVFVFPSKVEGFGLPILEAMATGTPTIVADLEPMRSIAQEAALLVDPDRPADLARLLRRIIEDDDLAETLGSRGRRRAGEFRWDETAQATLEVYGELGLR